MRRAVPFLVLATSELRCHSIIAPNRAMGVRHAKYHPTDTQLPRRWPRFGFRHDVQISDHNNVSRKWHVRTDLDRLLCLMPFGLINPIRQR